MNIKSTLLKVQKKWYGHVEKMVGQPGKIRKGISTTKREKYV